MFTTMSANYFHLPKSAISSFCNWQSLTTVSMYSEVHMSNFANSGNLWHLSLYIVKCTCPMLPFWQSLISAFLCSEVHVKSCLLGQYFSHQILLLLAIFNICLCIENIANSVSLYSKAHMPNLAIFGNFWHLPFYIGKCTCQILPILAIFVLLNLAVFCNL